MANRKSARNRSTPLNVQQEHSAERRGTKVDTRSAIKMVLDIPATELQRAWAGGGAPQPIPNGNRANVLNAIMQLEPIQRQRVQAASGHARGVLVTIWFPLSETRDVDEAIRSLPNHLQAHVQNVEKFAL